MSQHKIVIQNFDDEQQITIGNIVQITAYGNLAMTIDLPIAGFDTQRDEKTGRLTITPTTGTIESVAATPGQQPATTEVMHPATTIRS